jgi:hypothetical protein
MFEIVGGIDRVGKRQCGLNSAPCCVASKSLVIRILAESVQVACNIMWENHFRPASR